VVAGAGVVSLLVVASGVISEISEALLLVVAAVAAGVISDRYL